MLNCESRPRVKIKVSFLSFVKPSFCLFLLISCLLFVIPSGFGVTFTKFSSQISEISKYPLSLESRGQTAIKTTPKKREKTLQFVACSTLYVTFVRHAVFSRRGRQPEKNCEICVFTKNGKNTNLPPDSLQWNGSRRTLSEISWLGMHWEKKKC